MRDFAIWHIRALRTVSSNYIVSPHTFASCTAGCRPFYIYKKNTRLLSCDVVVVRDTLPLLVGFYPSILQLAPKENALRKCMASEGNSVVNGAKVRLSYLHWLLMRLCSQMIDPPYFLQLLLWLLCSQMLQAG